MPSLSFRKSTFNALAIVGAIICLIISLPAAAQNVAAGCDPNFMAALNKKAEIEASRDLAVAQTLIKKPDSVFQLTCFDQLLSQTITLAGIFSESSVAPGSGIAGKLDGSIGQALRDYITLNYNHTILGGFPINPDASIGVIPTNNINNFVPGIINPIGPLVQGEGSSLQYACSQMNNVWWHAKCLDFDDSAFFYDDSRLIEAIATESISSNGTNPSIPKITSVLATPQPTTIANSFTHEGDLSRLGQQTASCTTQQDQDWLSMMDIAFNTNDQTYPFQENLRNVTESWFNIVSGESCGAGVLTGLTYKTGDNTYCSGFCSSSRCQFTAPRANNGSCQGIDTRNACN